MRLPRLFLMLAMAAPVAGCGGYLSVAGTQSLTQVKVGMTREEVIRTVGEPQRSELVGKTELLTYNPDWAVRLAENFSPVGIVDGKVAGFGPSYASSVRLNHASPIVTAATLRAPKTCSEAHELCKSQSPNRISECGVQRQWCMKGGTFMLVGTSSEFSDLALK